jgi:hypothetical protein
MRSEVEKVTRLLNISNLQLLFQRQHRVSKACGTNVVHLIIGCNVIGLIVGLLRLLQLYYRRQELP